MVVSVGTMQLALSTAFMQVTTSVGIMQVSRFHCNYAGVTFGYSYVVGFLVAIMKV